MNESLVNYIVKREGESGREWEREGERGREWKRVRPKVQAMNVSVEPEKSRSALVHEIQLLCKRGVTRVLSKQINISMI